MKIEEIFLNLVKIEEITQFSSIKRKFFPITY